MKEWKKRSSVFIAAFMSFTVAMPNNLVLAKQSTKSKEEVVYIMTQSDGTVNNINVVNIFDKGNVVDYGKYSSVKMLTTTDKIKQEGDKISFSSDAKKVYYQGTLKSKEIPWNISIRYFLDDKEYTANEIAGKSGALKIKFCISKNEKYEGNFYDDYALQATFLLDTDLCQNIKADAATVANVGSDKQLSYTILPGKGIKTQITADVESFEMNAVAINGVKLNLDINSGNTKDLTKKVTQFMDASKQLDSGSRKVYRGTKTVKTGTQSLNSGITNLKSGAAELNSGIVSLQDGMKSIQKGLNTLNSQSSKLEDGSSKMEFALKTIQKNLDGVSVSISKISQLTEASSKLEKGSEDLVNGIASLKTNIGYDKYKSIMSQKGLNIDSLKSKNQQAIKSSSSQVEALKQIVSDLEKEEGHEEEISKLKAQIESMEGTIQILNANQVAITGTESYFNQISSATNQLYSGAVTLKNQSQKFNAAIKELANNLEGMNKKISQLSNGINQLVINSGKLGKGIKGYTSGVANIVSGYDKMITGVSSLASGSKELLNGSSKLSSGSSELYSGILSLCKGAKKLNQGTSELSSKTSKMDEQLQDSIDEIFSSIGGKKTKTKSFVSEKNKKVKEVQFVIKTDAIEKEEVEKTEEKTSKNPSVWKKLTDLFKFK